MDGQFSLEQQFELLIRQNFDKSFADNNFGHAKNLAYLLELSRRTFDESETLEERKAFADAFTKQSVEIWGKPDSSLALTLESNSGGTIIEQYKKELTAVRERLLSQYADVFEALKLNDEAEIDARQLAAAFARGLLALQERDSRWQPWQIVCTDDDHCSVSGETKTIRIGRRRAPESAKNLKGLFAHEVLRHALTKVNSLSLGLDSGLPGYLSAEEGFAMVNEVAISGHFPTKIVDRYLDVAWALGELDGKKHTRPELIHRCYEREKARHHGKEPDNEAIQKIHAHVNRIFRGTPGTAQISGVFTKDYVYLSGFIPALAYIKQNLDQGQSINQLMDFVESAKFDPLNPDHVAQIRQLRAEHLS